MNDVRDNDKGFALLSVLIFSVVLTIMGLSMIVLSATETMIVHNRKLKGEAFYVAEGGLEKQIADIYDLSSDGTIPTQEELLSLSEVPPDFEGYSFPEYGVERDGDASVSTITMGPYSGLFALVQPYAMVSKAVGPGSVVCRMERWAEHHLIPVFQFGVFYDQDLEILPGPVMTFGGRVHSNNDLYVGCNVDLYFDSNVTAAGSIFNERKDQPTTPPGDVWFKDDTNEYQLMTFDSRDPDWRERAMALWGGRVRDSAHGIIPIGLPLPIGMDPVEIIKRGVEGDSEAYRAARLYYMADLKIIDGVATDRNDMPVDLDPDILSTHTFYNFREEKVLTATQLDVKELRTSGQAPENGILYISASETAPDARDAVVRLVNGERLPSGGFTVVTDNPLYIMGDYNRIQPQPAAVLTDAINILSGAWDDANSHKPLSQRIPTVTSVRVAVMAGNMETTVGNYNGGLENFLRFLERWNGKRLTYVGSLVCMWHSEWATGQWYYGGNYYTAPERDWSFDTSFYDPDLLPPGTPNILNFEPGEWIYE